MRTGTSRRGHAAALAAAMVLAGLVLPAIPADAKAQVPGCTVDLDQMSAVAHPTSTASDTIEFTGTVHVTLTPITTPRNVQLLATTQPEAWGASIDPATQEVTGEGDIPFTASVGVPAAELSATNGRLTVRASFAYVTGGPTVECSSVANIQVAQYFGVNSDAITPRFEVKTGAVGAVATVLVHNLGNGRDSFRVELENRADLEALGIITSLPLQAPLDPNQQTNVTFTVNASSAVDEGAYDLFIMVTSLNDPTVRQDTQMKVDVKVSIIDTIFDPTVFIVLAAVGAGAVGAVAFVRSRRRKRRARLAKRQLDRIRRQQRGGPAAVTQPAEKGPKGAKGGGSAVEKSPAGNAPRKPSP